MNGQRKFDGKIYKEYTFCPKSNVEYYRESLKASGYLVRTIAVKNGYVVYVRKG